MEGDNMLVLTDHSNHSRENSLYPLVQVMRKHPLCKRIDIASRGEVLNDAFFTEASGAALYAVKGDRKFEFQRKLSLF